MTSDIFISFKNLDESGAPTRDAEIAREVYDFLTLKELSAFISTVTLERLGASDYKREIDDALDAATIVVAIGTSIENLNSGRVRYEWDSFYVDILSGIKPRGRLFAYVESLLPAQLPRTLRQTQTFVHSPEALRHLYSFVVQALRQEPSATSGTPLPLESVPHRQPAAATASKPRPRVFISSSRDDVSYARALTEVIVQSGFDVFSGNELFAGDRDDWSRAIEREIQACAFFVPIISENTEERIEAYFRREWYLASERSLRSAPDQVFILPVVIGRLETPTLIPETFQRVQWIRMDEPTVPPSLVDFFRRHAWT